MQRHRVSPFAKTAHMPPAPELSEEDPALQCTARYCLLCVRVHLEVVDMDLDGSSTRQVVT